MLHSCTISLLLLLAILPAPTVSSDTPKSLQFGSTVSDYVKFSPDMSRVKNALTVCSWVKKMVSGTIRSWITYTTSRDNDQILISDAGQYNVIHSSYLNLGSDVKVPLNTWTHQCQSWSTSTGQLRVYYNGTLIGTQSVSNRALDVGGYITLGQDASSPSSSEIFGGQLLKLNVFGRVLTDEEIAGMYAAGMCSEVEKNYDDVRFITWERILRETKTGNVSEVESGCPAPEEEEEEEEECICPSYSMWNVLLEEKYVKQNLTEEKLTELKSTWTILGKLMLSFIELFSLKQTSTTVSVSVNT